MPTHIDGNTKVFGGNNKKGTGNNKREKIPKVNHTSPMLAAKPSIPSTYATAESLSKYIQDDVINARSITITNKLIDFLAFAFNSNNIAGIVKLVSWDASGWRNRITEIVKTTAAVRLNDFKVNFHNNNRATGNITIATFTCMTPMDTHLCTPFKPGLKKVHNKNKSGIRIKNGLTLPKLILVIYLIKRYETIPAITKNTIFCIPD
jgi:hypothetical protein